MLAPLAGRISPRYSICFHDAAPSPPGAPGRGLNLKSQSDKTMTDTNSPADERKIILTGDRPTGPLHLGHYIGSLQNRVKLQEEYKTYIMIADVQALTDNFDDPEKLRKNTLEVMYDYLAAGLDPEKATFVLQSMIPEIHELTIYYLNMVTVARTLRNPTVKAELVQKREQGKTEMFGKGAEEGEDGEENDEFAFPVGFMIYPVHQSADITVFDADLVPVGADQLPMLEQAREIARRMNHFYGEGTLKEPEPLVGSFGRLPGTDGKAKMSKSIGNAIYLSDDRKTVEKKVGGMFTDPKRIRADIPGTVEGNPVFTYHDAFNPDVEQVEDFKRRYREGKVGDVEVKQALARALNEMLDPIRERRAEFASKPKAVREMLFDHTLKARREQCRPMLNRVRKAMALKPIKDRL